MPINQYAYFAPSSNDISAAEMADIFGIEPDESMVRSSRIAGSSPRPRCHVWKIVCREPGLCVDEQVARIVERLIPYTEAIAELTPDQPERVAGPEIQAATPNLFGWHLGRNVLDFLYTAGAAQDADEYDMTANYDEG